MTVADLPQLPLVCLRTADSKDTQQVISGKPTIIGTSALGTIGLVHHQVQKVRADRPLAAGGVVHHPPQRSTQQILTILPCCFWDKLVVRLLDDSVYPMSGSLGQVGSDGGRPQVRKCPIY